MYMSKEIFGISVQDVKYSIMLHSFLNDKWKIRSGNVCYHLPKYEGEIEDIPIYMEERYFFIWQTDEFDDGFETLTGRSCKYTIGIKGKNSYIWIPTINQIHNVLNDLNLQYKTNRSLPGKWSISLLVGRDNPISATRSDEFNGFRLSDSLLKALFHYLVENGRL